MCLLCAYFLLYSSITQVNFLPLKQEQEWLIITHNLTDYFYLGQYCPLIFPVTLAPMTTCFRQIKFCFTLTTY